MERDDNAFRKAEAYLFSKSFEEIEKALGATGEFFVTESGHRYQCLCVFERETAGISVELFVVTYGKPGDVMVGIQQYYLITPDGAWKLTDLPSEDQ